MEREIVKIRKIALPTEARKRIAEVFDTTLANVCYALRYTHKGDKARRMRCMAIELGGIILRELPECETIYQTAEGRMEQTLSNGVRLVLEMSDNTVKVYDGCDLIATHKSVDLSTLEYIQAQESQRRRSSVGLYH